MVTWKHGLMQHRLLSCLRGGAAGRSGIAVGGHALLRRPAHGLLHLLQRRARHRRDHRQPPPLPAHQQLAMSSWMLWAQSMEGD